MAQAEGGQQERAQIGNGDLGPGSNFAVANPNIQQMGMQGGQMQMAGGFPMVNNPNFPQLVPVGMGLGQFGFLPQEQMAQQYQYLLSNMAKQETLKLQGHQKDEGEKGTSKKKDAGSNIKEMF